MFFKKELQMAADRDDCERIRKKLESVGIKYTVVNKAADSVQRGGEAGEQFQILVKRRDFKKARSLFKF